MRKSHFYLFAILCFFLSFSCSKLNKNPINTPTSYNASYYYEIAGKDELIIPVPEGRFSKFHSLAIFADRLVYGVNLNAPNVVDVYDILSKEMVKSIRVDPAMITDRISGIYVVSQDSIFFCQSLPLTIFLINSEGIVLNKWDEKALNIDPVDDNFLSQYPVQFTTFLSAYKPVVIGEQIFVPLDPSGAYNIIPQIARIGVYSLTDNKWTSFFASAGSIESNRPGQCYPYDIEHPYLTKGENDNIIVSYPMDHYVYLYESKTNKLLRKEPCYSKYVSSLPAPPSSKEMDNCQKNMNFRIKTPFYGPLFYHEKINKYSRIIHHPQHLIDNTGNVSDGTQRTASIIFMDSEFNIIGEAVFDNGSLGVHSYLPLSDGILISSQNNNENEEYLAYNRIIRLK